MAVERHGLGHTGRSLRFSAEADEDVGTADAERDEEDETPQQSTARWAAAWSDIEGRFRAGASDSTWAAGAKRSLESELPQAVLENTEFVGVSCRGRICLANFSWPDYGTAQKESEAVMYGGFSVNCARTIMLPVPVDNDAAYSGTIAFDCETDQGRPLPLQARAQ